jgi:cyclopropane fatty-acyl-phospholipid synthase-like methyltransferase
MPVRVDPENNETRVLFDLAELSGQHVLEIGCGDGRLTRRYAGRATRVTAVDPWAEGIARARKNLPGELQTRVEFRPIAFLDFAAATEPSAFDVAIFAWSL